MVSNEDSQILDEMVGTMEGFTVDHVRRGWRYLQEHRRLDAGRPVSTYVLMELGAVLAIRDLISDGFLHVLAPGCRDSVGRCNFLARVLAILAQHPRNLRLTGMGICAERAMWFRLRFEDWHTGQSRLLGRAHARLELDATALDAVAHFLWANRHVPAHS